MAAQSYYQLAVLISVKYSPAMTNIVLAIAIKVIGSTKNNDASNITKIGVAL